MIASSTLNRYPYFDMLEIIPELENIFRPYKPLQPVKAGDRVPDFELQKENSNWQQFFNGAQVHGPVLLRQLLNKPLVIAFYSGHWQLHGLDLLKQLNTIQHEIKAQGGNLLIISAEEKEKRLETLVWEHSLSLSFYFDADKKIARVFRTYSDSDPVWNLFSGIDTNVPLLATYVISPSGHIEYDHIYRDFSKQLPEKKILSAVKYAGQHVLTKIL